MELRILRVNLTKKAIFDETLPQGFIERFVGGKGFAWLLAKELKPNIDPLSPDNKIILATGPLTGSGAPGFSGRHVVITKSPLTGIFLDTYAGGFWGARLRFAGYDAVVIDGRAEKPVYLWIYDGKAEIRDAREMWGKTISETDRLVKEDVGEANTSVAAIGPAGENLVKFACIANDGGREAGRGGSGAVMGSKNLKAIAVTGKPSSKISRVTIARSEVFESTCSELRERIKKNPITGIMLPSLGTPGFVNVANNLGGWRVRNAREGVFERAEDISGEAMKEKIYIRSTSCYGCPIGCRKISQIKTGPYASTLEGPEFESICLLGANCGVGDLEPLAYTSHLCDELGMDTISTGVVIGFAMELYERGIISKADTDGLELKFGNYEAMIDMVKKIAKREGLGSILAEGVRRASGIIGKGSEYYADHVKGLEMPAWEPRAFWGHALSVCLSDRGACHTHSPVLDLDIVGKLDRFSIDGKPEALKQGEEFTAAKDTLIHCLFASQFTLLSPSFCASLLSSVVGIDFDERKFLLVGERIINLTRMFNVREGITRKDDYLPKRLMEQSHTIGPTSGKVLTKDLLDKMLDRYYELRGWDVKTGIPTRATLEALGLAELCGS
ncbi:MAG: aldehyde ferredoxin oxidoreductase family protein [Candidatus Nezhaarchaeota archaeon]|nr:aldehyde ferredoxin oxidoreductase family protein [Candidatus Nezhaarchaeota archaeon]MCX8142246.1 aldehyde ferredoxin oxidoreductase family protein [Candidatus Nezhaarchaeota archaeon]MDW8050781.1 aldehyde ferredoxin oxidoreductase family protein [Nitrososphaerota archaeon]